MVLRFHLAEALLEGGHTHKDILHNLKVNFGFIGEVSAR